MFIFIYKCLVRGAGVDFGSFDILSDEQVRAGLKVYSNWPTFPQVHAGSITPLRQECIQVFIFDPTIMVQAGLSRNMRVLAYHSGYCYCCDVPVWRYDQLWYRLSPRGLFSIAVELVSTLCTYVTSHLHLALVEKACRYCFVVANSLVRTASAVWSSRRCYFQHSRKKSAKILRVFISTPTPTCVTRFVDAQLYVKEVLVGGVDNVSKLAEQGDLKAQLALAVGVGNSARKTPPPAAAAGGVSVQDRCKELIKRSVSTMY